MADNTPIIVAELAPDGIASAKQEAWKYSATKLATLLKKPFQLIDSNIVESLIEKKQHSNAFINCIFINGTYFSGLSDPLPAGVTITIKEDIDGPLSHPLAAISAKIEKRAAVIEIKPQAIIEKPLYLHHITTGQEAYNNTRLHIKAGRNSMSKICEHHVGNNPQESYWTNRIQVIEIEPEAQCDHYVLQTENAHAVFTSLTEVSLQEKSHYHHYNFTLGAALARNEIHTHIKGKQVESDIKGLFLGKEKQCSDFYLPTTHHASDSISHQKIYGILDDQAQGTFYGKVIVPQDSQRTESHQMNRNVLLSPKAQVNSRPELEIYADDVQCSHGSATGELDSMALYYLQARGLNKEQAQIMLLDGFMHEIVNAVTHPEIKGIIESEVALWLNQ